MQLSLEGLNGPMDCESTYMQQLLLTYIYFKSYYFGLSHVSYSSSFNDIHEK